MFKGAVVLSKFSYKISQSFFALKTMSCIFAYYDSPLHALIYVFYVLDAPNSL